MIRRRFNPRGQTKPMSLRLNVDQQSDEVRDIKNFIRDLDPIAIVELQTQQVRRLIYFAEKGIRTYKEVRMKMNPEMAKEVDYREEQEA